VKLSDITDSTVDALKSFGAFATDTVQPTVRLGVTGLSRAGKTVFVTALVRNLVLFRSLPFFPAHAEGRIERVVLEPQPDDDVPRFRYEDHLDGFARERPVWPEGTKRVSQIRLAIDYTPRSAMRRMLEPAFGRARLNVDIVDYPGEWLIDLAMLEQDFAAWSARALAAGEAPHRRDAVASFRDFVGSIDADAALDEAVAQKGAALYTDYLRASREKEPALSTLGPGRFLMPGDLEGSPLLTFFPLPAGADAGSPKGSLRAAMERRYESYKTLVARPFWRNHFCRIDRQIVLFDALAALNSGPAALGDMSQAMTEVLKAFRPGASTLVSRMFQRRIDKILFVATKADHLHHTSHDRLEALARTMADAAIVRAEFAGAEVRSMAVAAIRATREAEAEIDGGSLPCIVGTPRKGEKVGDTVFDGETETALFPGDLPADPARLIRGDEGELPAGAHDVRVLTFLPPRLTLETPGGKRPAPPHIRLDRAIDFLIGDKLA